LMTFYFNGSRSPSNLYVYDFATKKVLKLTDSLNPKSTRPISSSQK
jgi:hypothetical protein